MRMQSVATRITAVSALLLVSVGCASSAGDEASGAAELGTGGVCHACLADSDCGGRDVCAQFQSDIYCAVTCPNGDECSSEAKCTTVTTSSGAETNVCVPNDNACGPNAGPVESAAAKKKDAGARDSGTTCGAPATSCGSLVDPTTPASCTSCGTGKTHPCQANGCYGGWWCDMSTDRCQTPPTSCGGSGTCDAGAPPLDAGGGGSPDAGSGGGDAGTDAGGGGGGGGGGGTIGENGGTVDSLYFSVMGDTRPPVINDTKGYPTAIAQEIYTDMANLSPRPQFAVATGDYMFATPGNGQSSVQLADYLTARSHYPNFVFPAMGNHECTGATNSNCGPSGAQGLTSNYTDFLSMLLGPIHKTTPYYSINVNGTDGSWTSKFVFVTGNAWDSTQATWLDATLAKPTTYTFIIRHEPSSASTAPGVSPSEKIMAKHPYTLAIVGHTHTYGKTGARQVTIGNGGAPLTGSATYGFGLLQQRSDKAIQVDMINYQTGAFDTTFRFALNPDGSAAAP